MPLNENEALPGFEPRSLESESNALTNYAITPTKAIILICQIKMGCIITDGENRTPDLSCVKAAS